VVCICSTPAVRCMCSCCHIGQFAVILLGTLNTTLMDGLVKLGKGGDIRHSRLTNNGEKVFVRWRCRFSLMSQPPCPSTRPRTVRLHPRTHAPDEVEDRHRVIAATKMLADNKKRSSSYAPAEKQRQLARCYALPSGLTSRVSRQTGASISTVAPVS
jgi:hypothetical protein